MYAVITDAFVNDNAKDLAGHFGEEIVESVIVRSNKVDLTKMGEELSNLIEDAWFVTPDRNISNMLHIFYTKRIDTDRMISIFENHSKVMLCYGLSHSLCIRIGAGLDVLDSWGVEYLAYVHKLRIISPQVLDANGISLLGL